MKHISITGKPRIAVHKFASCDGCQLAFLNLGEDLITLTQRCDIVHFAEAGPVAPDEAVDIAFIEGSVTTKHDAERIKTIRANSKYLVTIGACATAGGIQALKNGQDVVGWTEAVYAKPEFIDTLATSDAIAEHVRVDFELWGCPITSAQISAAVTAMLSGVMPVVKTDSVCMKCKQDGNVCVLVAKGEPCMGPVTKTGCGALCPSIGRACYACYGPSDQVNASSLANRLTGLGLMPAKIIDRFNFINGNATAYVKAKDTLARKGVGSKS